MRTYTTRLINRFCNRHELFISSRSASAFAGEYEETNEIILDYEFLL